MKFKFKNQDFQTDAVNSVVDLFAGMAKGVNMFLVDDGAQVAWTGDLGEGNAIVVDDDSGRCHLRNCGLSERRYWGSPAAQKAVSSRRNSRSSRPGIRSAWCRRPDANLPGRSGRHS